jgi:hypothetical protein
MRENDGEMKAVAARRAFAAGSGRRSEAFRAAARGG